MKNLITKISLLTILSLILLNFQLAFWFEKRIVEDKIVWNIAYSPDSKSLVYIVSKDWKNYVIKD